MIRALSVAATALTAAGLLAAGPAVAATTAATPFGYVATSPSAVHGARVTLTVPSFSCGRTSPSRTLRVGLFGSESQAGAVRPISLTVDVTCRAGHTTVHAVYRNQGSSYDYVHVGDRVQLRLQGAQGYEVDDLTRGTDDGGASGSSGPAPKLERQMLFGAEVVGTRPGGTVRTAFAAPEVNGKRVEKLPHHRSGESARNRVGTLRDHRFQVTLLSR